MKLQENVLQQLQENMAMVKTLAARTEELVAQLSGTRSYVKKDKVIEDRPKKRSIFSAATRKKMSAAMKKRWALKTVGTVKLPAKKKAAN